ncbi:MAG: hypothetical protein JXB88_19420 [Spirochaetales bacterium]|nr:hypothetical protein [Spirochaetales bacterium]
MNVKSLLILFCLLITVQLYCEQNYDDLFDEYFPETENNDEETTGSSVDQTEEESSDGVDKNTDILKMELSGTSGCNFHVPFLDEYDDFLMPNVPGFTNKAGYSFQYKDVKVFSEWQIDLLLNEEGILNDFINVSPLENYVSWNSDILTIVMGYQNYNWGTADTINPTDNCNPKDYTNGNNIKDIPVLSLRISLFPFDWLQTNIVYIPYKQKDIFNTDFYSLLSNQFPTSTIDINHPDFSIESFIIGTKTNFYLKYLDFSFSYIYDIDPFYTPEITLAAEDISAMYSLPPGSVYSYARVDSIDLAQERIHRFGFDFRSAIEAVGVWGEICYSLTTDYDLSTYKIRNHKLLWIAGLDFNYGPEDEFYLNFQYAGQYIPGFDDKFYTDYPGGMPDSDQMTDKSAMEEFYYRSLANALGNETEGLLHGFILKADWPLFNSFVTPSIAIAYFLPQLYDTKKETRLGGVIANPEIDVMPVDSFHLLFGADLFYSWYKEKDSSDIEIYENDRVGMYYKNNNFYIKAIFYWNY